MCFHSGALVALGLTELPAFGRVLLASLIVASLVRFFLDTRINSARRIHSIMIGQQHCVVKFANKELVTALPSLEFFSEYMLLLRFKSSVNNRLNKGFKLLLLADSLNDDEDRRLRRYLRFDLPRQPM